MIFFQCEIYIDDIIIFGDTDESFLVNLTKIKRVRLVNPSKAKMTYSEVEAVGHVMDRYGIRMSQEKLTKVMDFTVPKYGTQLKQFLGLANYFRDHVRNHGGLARPLDKLVANYKIAKHKVVPWTEETISAFKSLQQAIATCPKLFFMVDDAATYLETDASDYGIGAFLYQMVQQPAQAPGTLSLQPIAFMSQSLTPSEHNWSTIEKECFAIYTSVKLWEYLLSGRFFTLKTDHKNLQFMNENTPKVIKWKLAIQEFNFQLEYLPGPHNVVADSLSRIHRDEDSCDRENVAEALAELPTENESRKRTIQSISTCRISHLSAAIQQEREWSSMYNIIMYTTDNGMSARRI